MRLDQRIDPIGVERQRRAGAYEDEGCERCALADRGQVRADVDVERPPVGGAREKVNPSATRKVHGAPLGARFDDRRDEQIGSEQIGVVGGRAGARIIGVGERQRTNRGKPSS